MTAAAEQLKRAEAKAKRERLEHLALRDLRAGKCLKGCVREHKFDPVRQWRFDFAWPALKVALECEGITYEGGRHQRPAGFEDDCRKYNAAALQGWQVLRYTARMIASGQMLRDLEKALAASKVARGLGL